jgi:hypothetical protein
VKDLAPTLPPGPFGPMTLLRLRKSESLQLSSYLAGEGQMIAMEDALRRELTACPELTDANVEDIWLAGIEMRHIVEGRADKSAHFQFPRIDLDERVWLAFVLGFLRYSFDTALAIERLPRERFADILPRIEQERSQRGKPIPLGAPKRASAAPER